MASCCLGCLSPLPLDPAATRYEVAHQGTRSSPSAPVSLSQAARSFKPSEFSIAPIIDYTSRSDERSIEEIVNSRSALDNFILRMIVRVNRQKTRSHPCACICGLAAVLALPLLILLLISGSVQKLGPYKYGLLQNAVTGRVHLDEVYEPGVYFVGFWNQFLAFPSTIGTIQYSYDPPEEGALHAPPIHLRSYDLVPLHLEVAVQYRRRKEALPELFLAAMTPSLQENLFASVLRGELIKVMSRHAAAESWQRRAQLVREFKEVCRESLAHLHADCWGLQLYRSHLSAQYETALLNTQLEKQQLQIEEARRDAALVRAETRVLLMNFSSRIKVLEAHGAAERSLLYKAAVAQAEASKVRAEASAFSHVFERLRLKDGRGLSAHSLVEYQGALTLGDGSLQGARLFFGLGGPPEYVAAVGGG